MQTPSEIATAVDLYKFATTGANTLWTFFSTVGLATVTLAFGGRSTLPGRGKLALAISFLVFALANNWLIVIKQQFATAAYEVMTNGGVCSLKPPTPFSRLICAAKPMEPVLVSVGHLLTTAAILAAIYMAHRRDRLVPIELSME